MADRTAAGARPLEVRTISRFPMPTCRSTRSLRAQSSTQITGPDDSILEWAGEHGRQRRLQRRIIYLIGLGATILITLGAGAIYAWLSTQP